jgi:hypothetical protein
MTRRITLAATMTVALVLGVATAAQASRNVDWLYSQGGQGRGLFDADVAGWTGAEELKACDIATDGHSVIVSLYDYSTGNRIDSVVDTYNDGSCTSTAYNMVTDERVVELEVCDYNGSFSGRWDCAYALGVS